MTDQNSEALLQESESLSENAPEQRWVIRTRGLPYDATPEKIANFFHDCDIVGGKDGIHIKLTPEGNSSGEAYIELASEDDAKKAFHHHNEHMGHRYVEVFQSNVSEMEWCLNQVKESKATESSCVVRLRGLPWSATPAEIVKFLHDVSICGGEQGVHITLTPDGRSTGEAFVEVVSEDQVDAALAHSKENMGKRYVEVFRATKGQMEWAVMQEESKGTGNIGGVVRLRGLPYGCTEEKIIKFFSGLKILPNGVVMQYGEDGRETGEAYVQFCSSEDAEKALERHKLRIDHRYIEVFNSSVSDIKPVVPKVVPPMMRPAPYERPRGDYGGYGGYGGYAGFRGRQSGYERQYRGGMHGFGDYPMGPPRPGGLISYPQMRPTKMGGGGLLPGMMGMNNHEVRMRGLPYSATQNDIKNFFSPLVPQNVEIMFDDYGRPTGEAMVSFVSHEDAVAAMKKDREHMQHRYVELFLHSQPDPSGRSFNSYNYNNPAPTSTLLATPTNSANSAAPLMGGYNTTVVNQALPQQSANQNWNEPSVIAPHQQPSYSGYGVGGTDSGQGYASQTVSRPTAGGYGTPSLIQPQLLRSQMKDQWYQ